MGTLDEDRCMSSTERVRSFLEEYANAAFCDLCVAETMELVSRRQVQDTVVRLVGEGILIRKSGKCKRCGQIRIVTRCVVLSERRSAK
jgi:hypothetical protein